MDRDSSKGPPHKAFSTREYSTLSFYTMMPCIKGQGRTDKKTHLVTHMHKQQKNKRKKPFFEYNTK